MDAPDRIEKPSERDISKQILRVRYLRGLQPYEPVWKAMQQFTDMRSPDDFDEVWLLEHLPVFTQGQAGKAEHVLAPGDIPVVQVDRGGQVTYHGPGQIVVYLMLDIARMGIGPRELVSRIEQCLINVIGGYGQKARAKRDAPGVYIDDAKIASIGFRIRKGKSFHGLSLNVEMDMEPFRRINPCGYQNLKMIQLSDLVDLDSCQDVVQSLISEIHKVFGYRELLLDQAGQIPEQWLNSQNCQEKMPQDTPQEKL